MRIAVIAITRNGALLGQRLRDGLAGAELYVSSRYAGQAGSVKQLFDPTDLKELIASLWPECTGFVFIMASGIVVRMVATAFGVKRKGPGRGRDGRCREICHLTPLRSSGWRQ